MEYIKNLRNAIIANVEERLSYDYPGPINGTVHPSYEQIRDSKIVQKALMEMPLDIREYGFRVAIDSLVVDAILQENYIGYYTYSAANDILAANFARAVSEGDY